MNNFGRALPLPILFSLFSIQFFNFEIVSILARSAVYRYAQELKSENIQNLVGSSGLEPPTSRLSGVRSNHLSYEPIFLELGKCFSSLYHF